MLVLIAILQKPFSYKMEIKYLFSKVRDFCKTTNIHGVSYLTNDYG